MLTLDDRDYIDAAMPAVPQELRLRLMEVLTEVRDYDPGSGPLYLACVHLAGSAARASMIAKQ